METQYKVGAGISVTGIVILLFHVFHTAHSVTTIGEEDKNDVFKNAPVYFIQTDSAGKKDTMLLQDYLKKDSTRR